MPAHAQPSARRASARRIMLGPPPHYCARGDQRNVHWGGPPKSMESPPMGVSGPRMASDPVGSPDPAGSQQSTGAPKLWGRHRAWGLRGLLWARWPRSPWRRRGPCAGRCGNVAAPYEAAGPNRRSPEGPKRHSVPWRRRDLRGQLSLLDTHTHTHFAIISVMVCGFSSTLRWAILRLVVYVRSAWGRLGSIWD